MKKGKSLRVVEQSNHVPGGQLEPKPTYGQQQMTQLSQYSYQASIFPAASEIAILDQVDKNFSTKVMELTELNMRHGHALDKLELDANKEISIAQINAPMKKDQMNNWFSVIPVVIGAAFSYLLIEKAQYSYVPWVFGVSMISSAGLYIVRSWPKGSQEAPSTP